jgi:hypothetical protein
MAATRNQLLARLHCIKKEQGWDDETYRDILWLRTGKRSAAELDGFALTRLVAQLGGQKPRSGPRPGNEWAFIDHAAPNCQPLLRKICVMARNRGVGKAYVEGIAANMDTRIRQFRDGAAEGTACRVTKPLEFCTLDELWRIVNALIADAQRKPA